MDDPLSVCIRCGHYKRRALSKCPHCGFVPSTAEDQARSLILSPLFDAGEHVVGSTPQQLAAAAAGIQAGQSHEFVATEVARVAELHEQAQSISPSRLVGDLARWLAGPALILAVAYWLIWRQ